MTTCAFCLREIDRKETPLPGNRTVCAAHVGAPGAGAPLPPPSDIFEPKGKALFRQLTRSFIYGDLPPQEEAALVAEKQRLIYGGAYPACGLILEHPLLGCVRVVDAGTVWGVMTRDGRAHLPPVGSAATAWPDLTRSLVRETCGVVTLEGRADHADSAVDALRARVAALEARIAAMDEANLDRSIAEVEAEIGPPTADDVRVVYHTAEMGAPGRIAK